LKRIKTHLPLLQRSLQLYLANRETEFILYRPIKVRCAALLKVSDSLGLLSNPQNKVVGAFLALQQALTAGGYSADQLLVVGCPTPEQVSVMLSAALASSNLAITSSNPDDK
jgi:conserved oligomeric Golgi complex subunit 3